MRRQSEPVSVADWRRAARRALPEMIWAYVEDGADSCRTARQNEEAFQQYNLKQRVLAGITSPKLSTTVAGESVSIPVLLAPTGMTGLSHWTGDLACARAAESVGTRYVLSTGSSYTLEEVAAVVEAPQWFQLYPFGDRAKVGSLLERAAAVGFTALVLTVDVPVRGNREIERASGLTVPPTLTPGGLLDLLMHPRWTLGALIHKRTAAIHYLEGDRRGGSAAVRSIQAQARAMQPNLNWDDLKWIRDRWRGRLYVKGILDADDAQRAVEDGGADGVVVSNHGGRQLDGAPATLDALPPIVKRIGRSAEVLMDGGLRRGGDAVIAMCLGAKAVFIGRPYVYGLAAAAQVGVEQVLSLFRQDIERTLILMGCPDIARLDESWLTRRLPVDAAPSMTQRTAAGVMLDRVGAQMKRTQPE
jgi:L-lactate dehydrogenase (cytochrome)/(S)-mandelate dehydrogenase